MGVLIDATVLIAYERGHLDLEHKLAGREAEEFFLSVITASELLHGVHRATEAHRARRSAFVEAILERFRFCNQIWLQLGFTPKCGLDCPRQEW